MTLTIGVLSWGAHRTLLNTLDSYKLWGLDELADQKIIYFQEISSLDKAIATQYGYEAIGTPENIGIAGGYKGLVEHATGSLFLFLENDWVLIQKPVTQITTGAVLLEAGAVDMVKYRSREYPGAPLWSQQFAGKENERPEYLLDSLHWNENPDMIRIENEDGSWQYPITKLPFGWYRTTSQFANWTNNPTMFRTELLEYLVHRFEGDIEVGIQSWWQEVIPYFHVAQGDGLFTHNRIDR